MKKTGTVICLFALLIASIVFLPENVQAKKIKEFQITESMVRKAVNKKAVSVKVPMKRNQLTEMVQTKVVFKTKSIDSVEIEEPSVKKTTANVKVTVTQPYKNGTVKAAFRLTYKYGSEKWKLKMVKNLIKSYVGDESGGSSDETEPDIDISGFHVVVSEKDIGATTKYSEYSPENYTAYDFVDAEAIVFRSAEYNKLYNKKMAAAEKLVKAKKYFDAWLTYVNIGRDFCERNYDGDYATVAYDLAIKLVKKYKAGELSSVRSLKYNTYSIALEWYFKDHR